jgi:hypothetical protein
MAEKRMFTKTIVDSDIFLDMPQSAQNLYFHLNMRADDEGFINSPKKIMRMVNSNQNDMDILLAKRYLLSFPSGVIVVKHWKMHNAIRQDRLKETMYLEEKAMLSTKENGSYTDNIKLLQPNDNQVTDNVSPSLDQSRLEENSIEEVSKPKKEPKQHYHDFNLVMLTNKEYETCINVYGLDKTKEALEKLHFYKLSSGKKYKSDYGALNNWVWDKVKAVKLSEIKKQDETVCEVF